MNSTVHISLSHLRANLNSISKRLATGVRTLAVVKDNAYGHGAIPIAKALEDRVYGFCVARVEEGKALREVGITLPVLVFEIPTAKTADLYPKYDLTATVADMKTFDILAPGTSYHLNFDTGMRRLGILPSELHQAKKAISTRTDCTPAGIYTHLYMADIPENSEVFKQLSLFKSIRSEFPNEWLTHAANSGGVFYYPSSEVQFDAVRPGIGLYGYSPGSKKIEELQPVMEVHSVFDQVKPIRQGETVSYGAQWSAPFDGWIGVVPAGYSSGIPRRLSGQFTVFAAGKRYPQVGTITMDYFMVFLGKDRLEPGTPVQIMGQQSLNAAQWAQKAETITYEIITGINWEIPRRYSC